MQTSNACIAGDEWLADTSSVRQARGGLGDSIAQPERARGRFGAAPEVVALVRDRCAPLRRRDLALTNRLLELTCETIARVEAPRPTAPAV
jgi:hypothetical protein